MAKLSLNELRAVREKESLRMKKRDISHKDCHIVVGMGTCGIEAGAKIVLDAIVDEIEKQGLDNVIVTQSGCLGNCEQEPMVEIHNEKLGTVAYGKVDVKVAKAIVNDHIIGGKLIEDHIVAAEG